MNGSLKLRRFFGSARKKGGEEEGEGRFDRGHKKGVGEEEYLVAAAATIGRN